VLRLALGLLRGVGELLFRMVELLLCHFEVHLQLVELLARLDQFELDALLGLDLAQTLEPLVLERVLVLLLDGDRDVG